MRGLERKPLAEGDEQLPVGREHKPRPEMIPAGDLWKLPEDHLDIIDAAVTELATGNGGSGVVFTRLRIGEIDQPVVGEKGIERHVEQPALALREDLWHALERLGL